MCLLSRFRNINFSQDKNTNAVVQNMLNSACRICLSFMFLPLKIRVLQMQILFSNENTFFSQMKIFFHK